jgi:aminoglycoside/choline kinase family phosphotransferase
MQRFERMMLWLGTVLRQETFDIVRLLGDASDRQYFRITRSEGSTLIAVNAPPTAENCGRFILVRDVFAGAGLHVPIVHAVDVELGFLLLEDLGVSTYHDALNPSVATELYLDAVDALVTLQLATRPHVLPEEDGTLLAEEIDWFVVWYLRCEAKVELTVAQLQDFLLTKQLLLRHFNAATRVFVHRDYHSRNLLVSSPNPGVVDFQGARRGSIYYDVASLFRDAYIELDESLMTELVAQYHRKAMAAGLPIATDAKEVLCEFDFASVQRHLKVIGVFARLAHRDGKDSYLSYIPRVWSYLCKAAERQPALKPLRLLLNEIQNQVEIP